MAADTERPALAWRELTASGSGGVSVLELSGPETLGRLARLVLGPLEPGPPRVVHLRTPGGELLDEALLWVRGQQRVELHVHGSPPLVARLRAELAPDAEGGPMAPPGLEARARAALAGAPSEAAARVLLDQAEGALRRDLEALRQESTSERAARLAGLVEAGRRARALWELPRVVLAGPVNAGKSSLFNVMVGRERAVVDDTQGTTRDALEEQVAVGDWTVRLFDTAGLREVPAEERGGAGRVELAGQELARSLVGRAHLVLWLDPDPAQPTPRTGAPIQRWTSRADGLTPGARACAPRPLSIRAADAADAAEWVARRRLADGIREGLGLSDPAWSPGAPVPFDAPSRDGVAQLLERVAQADFTEHLDSLLGG